MITISSIPTVVLARDPLPITFASNNYEQTEGEKATAYIDFLRLGVIGDEFVFTFFDISYTFTCDGLTPIYLKDPTGLIFSPGNAETIDDYVQNVMLPLLQNHYGLTRYFRFYHNGTANRIFIEALTEGYIDPFTIIDTPTNFLTYVKGIPFGVNPGYRENFKINYEVVDAVTDQPLSPIESLEPNSGGEITVDIHEFLEKLASNTFELDSDYPFSTQFDNLKKVYIRFWETYGLDTPAVNAMNRTEFYVLEAGTSHREKAILNELGLRWYDVQLTNKYFLTKMPQDRNVLPGQKILLKWLQLSSSPGIILNIETLRIINNSPDTQLIQSSVMSPAQYQVYQFDVSPVRHNMASDIVSFRVWLTNSASAIISEIRTFTIDRNYYNNTRYFIFKNSLGGFDTIQALGYYRSDEEYKRERISVQLPPNYNLYHRETKVVSISQQTVFKVNLGFLNLHGAGREKWVNAVRELYSSTEAYELVDSELYPIDILTDKQKLFENDNYLPDFFEMEYAWAFTDNGSPSNLIS